jgi:4-nitrophenyl phosphatase
VNHALQVAKSQGAASIGILEESNSTMAELCDVVLTARVAEENNAVGVIPLASTLAHAAVGDILCASVLSARGHEGKEFTALHPGGAVGKQLEQKSTQTTGSNRERKLPELETIKGLILDMDGVLWHGEVPLPGLVEFFEVLDRRGIRYVLATNNPSKRPEGFAEKARGFGVPVGPADVVNSVLATVHYMKSHYPEGIRVHVIGEPAMKELIAEAGYILADEDVTAVIVALERGLTYETFKRGTLLIRSGADFIGTNGDPSYPTEEGFVPGSGMVVTALAASSDVTPLIIGKPERGIFDLALERLQLPRETIASVGDRLDTDIAGGQRYGTKTILLLSGIAQEEDLQRSPVQPDWIFSDLIALKHALETVAK